MNNSYDPNEQQSYDTQPEEPPFFADPAPLSLNQKEPVGFAFLRSFAAVWHLSGLPFPSLVCSLPF